MTYSKAHRYFSEYLENPEALTNPQKFLGPNSETVLNFWKWMDSLNQEQWTIVADRYRNLDYDALFAAREAAVDAAWEAASVAAVNAAWDAASVAAVNAAWFAAVDAAASATNELMGMHLLFEKGKKLTFVPLFDGL